MLSRKSGKYLMDMQAELMEVNRIDDLLTLIAQQRLARIATPHYQSPGKTLQPELQPRTGMHCKSKSANSLRGLNIGLPNRCLRVTDTLLNFAPLWRRERNFSGPQH
jgi:hypothetical protein